MDLVTAARASREREACTDDPGMDMLTVAKA